MSPEDAKSLKVGDILRCLSDRLIGFEPDAFYPVKRIGDMGDPVVEGTNGELPIYGSLYECFDLEGFHVATHTQAAVKPARLPIDSDARKHVPMATGLLDYFPDALAEVARLSQIGNDKHNPGQPLHWSRGKSDDHADCIIRHMVDRGTLDTDGVLHDAKVAWRALAQLQLALEARR